MIDVLAFGLFILFGVSALVIWPIMLHPTLPVRKKILLSLAAFIVLVPAGIALYLWLGAPPMAQIR